MHWRLRDLNCLPKVQYGLVTLRDIRRCNPLGTPRVL
jgi:hypothetical protein